MDATHNSELAAAITVERAYIASEIAELLVKEYGDPDAAEDNLNRLLARCSLRQKPFWGEVYTAIAQIRG